MNTKAKNKELDALIASYPRLFAYLGRLPHEDELDQKFELLLEWSYIPVGWQSILMELFAKIDAIFGNEEDLISRFRAAQIKEKFGALRMYYSIYFPDYDNLPPPEPRLVAIKGRLREAVDAATAKSKVTCLNCGAPGQMRHLGWIRPLCDACIAREMAAALDGGSS
jgi:hypothetical protein